MPAFNYKISDVDLDDTAFDNSPRVFEPLERGTYQAMVIASKVKRTKKNDGEFVELEFQIIDGPSAGRRHWERYNMKNPTKKTEEIATKQLSWVCKAVGVSIREMKTTEELHDIPLNIVLDVDYRDPTKNRIMQCQPIAAVIKPPQSSTKKPWERG